MQIHIDGKAYGPDQLNVEAPLSPDDEDADPDALEALSFSMRLPDGRLIRTELRRTLVRTDLVCLLNALLNLWGEGATFAAEEKLLTALRSKQTHTQKLLAEAQEAVKRYTQQRNQLEESIQLLEIAADHHHTKKEET